MYWNYYSSDVTCGVIAIVKHVVAERVLNIYCELMQYIFVIDVGGVFVAQHVISIMKIKPAASNHTCF